MNNAQQPLHDHANVWTASDLSADPHRDAEKADKVRRMFSAIARSYDLNNRVHSFGLDQRWRKAAVRAAQLTPADAVLDCACGTGDLTRAFADAGAHRVIGLDFTPAMLDVARTKRLRPAGHPDHTPARIDYIEGDAMALPFGDRSFDVVSIAFGIRNVTEPPKAVAEFKRVLRPGGRLVILEFDRPRFPPVRWANDLYTRLIMPRTATLISGDRSGAYRYLPRSIETWLSRDDMLAMIAGAGFSAPRATPLTFGVAACFSAVA